jgi:hypothetical protein
MNALAARGADSQGVLSANDEEEATDPESARTSLYLPMLLG